MIRSAMIATAALTFSTVAMADNTKLDLDIRIDPSKIVDTASAQKAFRSVKGQATKACSYFRDSNRRTYTDEICVQEILDQVTAALDNDDFTEVYASSKDAIKVAERKN